MPLTLTREQVRRVDELAVKTLAIPSIVLMENAARNAAEVVREQMGEAGQVAIICGGGNNGGDGYAMARHLVRFNMSVQLHAVTPPDKLTGDAATNYEICRRLGLMVHQGAEHDVGDVVVDALLGTGFTGQTVRPAAAEAIERINAAKAAGSRVVALDVPSGLDCQSGEPANFAVRADVTVTFVAMKTGFAQAAAKAHLGEVIVADIGLPESWVRGQLDL